MSETKSTSKVWTRMEMKRKDGTTVKLRFQEPPSERKEEALDFMMQNLLRDEVIYRASGVYDNESALQEYKVIVSKMVEVVPTHITACYVDDGSANGGALAAVSVVTLDKKTDSLAEALQLIQPKTKEIQMWFKALLVMEEVEDTLSKQYDFHYHGNGIIVHPDFRGLGIANEIVRLRRVICQENDIPMTAAWMTAKGSQRAAENNNWKTYTVLDPQELGAKSGLTFAQDAVPFKLMYITKD